MMYLHMEMGKKIFIVILALVAVGGFVFLSSKNRINTRNGPTPTASQPGNPANNSNSLAGPYKSPVPDELKQLGSPPPDNASDTDKGVFSEKIKSLARSVNVVTIGENCVLSPAIISLKSGSNLTFRNKDTLEHGLGITEEIRIMAGQDTTLKAIFRGPGTYGITCDGPDITGFIDLLE